MKPLLLFAGFWLVVAFILTLPNPKPPHKPNPKPSPSVLVIMRDEYGREVRKIVN